MASKTKTKQHEGSQRCEAALFDAGRALQRVEVLLVEARQHASGGPADRLIAAALTDAALEEVGRTVHEIDGLVKLPAGAA